MLLNEPKAKKLQCIDERQKSLNSCTREEEIIEEKDGYFEGTYKNEEFRKPADYDAACKDFFRNCEAIAPILQAVIKEYEGYSKDEIIRFIDADTIKEDILVSDLPAKITDAGTEMSSVYEKTVFYDIHFKALNPKLTSNSIEVRLHIDFEVQNEYVPTNPKYLIVNRAIYYAAREISSQLGVLTEKTNYNDLLQYLEGVFTSDLHKMCSNCLVQKYAEPHIS